MTETKNEVNKERKAKYTSKRGERNKERTQ